jgi:hypothetical protein
MNAERWFLPISFAPTLIGLVNLAMQEMPSQPDPFLFKTEPSEVSSWAKLHDVKNVFFIAENE